MSATADLDALISDFGQYGDLITTNDTVDRMQRVIVALSDGTLSPPNDALGNDSMVWLCKLIKYLESNVCPPAAPCPNLGPELIPPGALFVNDGSGNAIYQLTVTVGLTYFAAKVNSQNVVKYNVSTRSVTLSPSGLGLLFQGLTFSPDGTTLTLTATNGGQIGLPVVASVKQIL